MATIKITKAYDVRRYVDYYVNTDDLNTEQTITVSHSSITPTDGTDSEDVEDIIGDIPPVGIGYRDSDKPEVVYVIAEA